jgi:hypothetical protein
LEGAVSSAEEAISAVIDCLDVLGREALVSLASASVPWKPRSMFSAVVPIISSRVVHGDWHRQPLVFGSHIVLPASPDSFDVQGHEAEPPITFGFFFFFITKMGILIPSSSLFPIIANICKEVL